MGFLDFFKKVGNKISNVFKPVASTVGTVFKKAYETIKPVAVSVYNKVAPIVSKVADKVGSTAGKLLDSTTTLVDNVANLPKNGLNLLGSLSTPLVIAGVGILAVVLLLKK